jgi:hypothetical protein
MGKYCSVQHATLLGGDLVQLLLPRPQQEHHGSGPHHAEAGPLLHRDLYKLDVPDIPVPGPLLPPGCLQHPHLQGGQEIQLGQGSAIKVGEVKRASLVRAQLSS